MFWKRKISNLCDTILKSLKYNPEEWVQNNYTLRHLGSDIRVWISNGQRWVDIYNSDGEIGRVEVFTNHEKKLIWEAYSEWIRECSNRKIRKNTKVKEWHTNQWHI